MGSGVHFGRLCKYFLACVFADDVEAMYDACAFEHGVYRSSPWCAVFSDDDIKVMEYYEDLRYYWEYGYGHSINYEQTCDLLKDLIGYLR